MKFHTYFLCLISLISLATSIPEARAEVVLTPPDLNSYLKDSLSRVRTGATTERKETAGTLLALGGALVAAALGSAVAGNDYSVTAAPGIFLATGGVFSLAGLVLFFRDGPLEEELKNYDAMPEWKLDDLSEKVHTGQDLLNQQSIISERERWWGGAATVLAGATNVVLGDFVTTNSGTPRESMQSAGYFFGILGLSAMVYERALWSGGAMALLGLSNLTVYHIDPHSPSSDYLFISGGIIAGTGLLRFFKPKFAETEEARFREYVKSGHAAFSRPDIFVIPASNGLLDGLIAGAKFSFR